MILVDTCVLTRLADLNSFDRPAARRAVLAIREAGENLVIVPQNICEFWAVASRKTGSPTKGGENGLGMTIPNIVQWIEWFKRLCTLLPESTDVPAIWESLGKRHIPKGTAVYDTRLVAFMQVYKINHLLTFNTRHFKQYPITLINPKSVGTVWLLTGS